MGDRALLPMDITISNQENRLTEEAQTLELRLSSLTSTGKDFVVSEKLDDKVKAALSETGNSIMEK